MRPSRAAGCPRAGGHEQYCLICVGGTPAALAARACLSGAAPCHRCAGSGSPEALGAAAAAQRLQGLAAQLQAAAGENRVLRQQLAEQQLVRVPPSLQAQLGPMASASAVAAAAADLEAQLQQAEVEGSELRQQLGLPAAPSPAQGGAAEGVAAAAEQQAAQLAARAEEALAAGQEDEAEQLHSQASQLEALVAQLRQAESERAAELRQQLRAAVAVGSAVAAAEAAEQQAVARLDAASAASARQPPEEGGAGVEEEVASLQQQLAVARQHKEAAQAQLGELRELEEQLQACAAERQQLSAQLAAAQPAPGEAEPAEVAELRSQLADAQRRSTELLTRVDALAAAAAAAEPSVRLALQVGSGGEVAERLAAAEAKAARLRQQLEDLQVGLCLSGQLPTNRCTPLIDSARCLRSATCQFARSSPARPLRLCGKLRCPWRCTLQLRPNLPLLALQPLRLQLTLGSPEASGGARRSLEAALGGPAVVEASPSDLPLLTTEPSDVGAMTALLYSSEHASALTAERRAADAALLEYQKARGCAARPAAGGPAALVCGAPCCRRASCVGVQGR